MGQRRKQKSNGKCHQEWNEPCRRASSSLHDSSRTELYVRFIRRKVIIDIEKCLLSEDEMKTMMESLEALIKKSQLSLQMQQRLSTYLLFELR